MAVPDMGDLQLLSSTGAASVQVLQIIKGRRKYLIQQ
jgi:hypothetical protein